MSNKRLKILQTHKVISLIQHAQNQHYRMIGRDTDKKKSQDHLYKLYKDNSPAITYEGQLLKTVSHHTVSCTLSCIKSRFYIFWSFWFWVCSESHLICVVETVIHESSDERCFPHCKKQRTEVVFMFCLLFASLFLA